MTDVVASLVVASLMTVFIGIVMACERAGQCSLSNRLNSGYVDA